MGIGSSSFIRPLILSFAMVSLGVITLPSVSHGIDLSISLEKAINPFQSAGDKQWKLLIPWKMWPKS